MYRYEANEDGRAEMLSPGAAEFRAMYVPVGHYLCVAEIRPSARVDLGRAVGASARVYVEAMLATEVHGPSPH